MEQQVNRTIIEEYRQESIELVREQDYDFTDTVKLTSADIQNFLEGVNEEGVN